MTAKTYNVGIYCRLSNDDERDGESVSIENQKLLLQNYVRQRGWNEIDTYIDDGYRQLYFEGCGKSLACQDICPAGIPVEELMSRSNAAAVWKR